MRAIKRSGRVAAAVMTAAFGCAAILAPGAGATVPPKNCGTITVKSKRYQIKADQMRCGTATTYSRRYLRSRARPSGYRCSDFNGGTKLKFRCSKSVRVFFAIRR